MFNSIIPLDYIRNHYLYASPASYYCKNNNLLFIRSEYNLLNKTNVTGNKILFCPNLLDEPCFKYFSLHYHFKRNIRPNYRKVFEYFISFSFISMLVYSLSCYNKYSDCIFFALANWIPKSLFNNISIGSNQTDFDDNGNIIYWDYYSTVRFIKESQNNDTTFNYLSGKIISDYINVIDIKRTKLMPVLAYDADKNEEYIKTKKIVQYSLYKPTQKLWDLVERAKNNKLLFMTIDKSKIHNFFINKIRPLAYNCNKPIDYEQTKRISLKDIDTKIVKKYSGWRKSGETIPFISLNKGTRKFNEFTDDVIPVSPVELVIRELIEDNLSIELDNICYNIDKFYQIEKPECTFKKDENFDETTYFEFKPKKIIKIIKEAIYTKKYDEHLIYQLYEILAKCEVSKRKYYFKVNYIRKENGRFYAVKTYIQNLPKELRKIVFSNYTAIDMNCGVYSLMLNLGKKMNYKGSVKEISEMVVDRKKYRNSLVDEKLKITYEDVKDKLTMISFGCKMNVQKMIESSEYEFLFGPDDNYNLYNTCLYKDATPERKMDIAKWCAKSKVANLYNEISKLGKYLIKKFTKKVNGKTILQNSINNELLITKKTRYSFGKKLAFIYQSEESLILKEIYDNFKINKKRIKNIKGGFGLLLHDGIYINNNLLKNADNIALKFSEFIKTKFNYNIQYECDI